MFGDDSGVTALFTNHPKWEDGAAFNQALCGLYAAGVGPVAAIDPATATKLIPPSRYTELGKFVAEYLDRTVAVEGDGAGPRRPVVVTGAALGLPGTEQVFDRANLGRLLHGDQCISPIPPEIRDAILDQHITRLVKQPDGSGSFETIDTAADVIKLAGRAGPSIPSRSSASTPSGPSHWRTPPAWRSRQAWMRSRRRHRLVLHYKTTHIGTRLPERWGLPDELRDDTGVIFASAFPGLDAFAGYAHDYYMDRARREQLATLEAVRASATSSDGADTEALRAELDRHVAALRAEIDAHPYSFDRRFLFRILSMGHSQFAEFIGARGPNTQVNQACASTTQAITVAEDWIRAGRCRRVIVVAADNAASDNLLGWIGAGFLASGAAATDADVEEAALPFDRPRHGMIIGMGGEAIVVEVAEAAEERGIRPIAEVLSGVTANSAFHGTRLDVHHISAEMERVLTEAETMGRRPPRAGSADRLRFA